MHDVLRDLDLNALVVLDAVLSERSVSSAARGLGVHAAPQYALRLESDPTQDLPAERPTIVIVYRSLFSDRPHVLYPDIAMLLALARRTGTPFDGGLAAVEEGSLDRGEQELVQRGVVAPRSV